MSAKCQSVEVIVLGAITSNSIKLTSRYAFKGECYFKPKIITPINRKPVPPTYYVSLQPMKGVRGGYVSSVGDLMTTSHLTFAVRNAIEVNAHSRFIIILNNMTIDEEEAMKIAISDEYSYYRSLRSKEQALYRENKLHLYEYKED